MSEKLKLLLLGSPEIRWGDSPITGFRSDKARALLYYLAATRRTHMRPTLAGLLWGETPEAQARLSLNQTLSNLRKVVSSHLTITRQTVVFNTETPHWIDIVAYETNLKTLTPLKILMLWKKGSLYCGEIFWRAFTYERLQNMNSGYLLKAHVFANLLCPDWGRCPHNTQRAVT